MFDVAVFTNLSQDHLDYHGTMEAYFAAKARLFTPDTRSAAVVNVDDPAGRRLLRTARRSRRRRSASGPRGRPAGHDVVIDARRALVRAWTGSRSAPRLRGAVQRGELPGRDGGGPRRSASRTRPSGAASRRSPACPGRVEPVEAGQEFLVVVDYAHTPDSIENVLRASRPLASGRVIVVFGCGGDRDRAKRPLMGAAATANADLTSSPATTRVRRTRSRSSRRSSRARRGRRRVRRRARPPGGDPARVREAGRATWSSSPGKGHEPGRSSPDGRSRSTIESWPARSSSALGSGA